MDTTELLTNTAYMVQVVVVTTLEKLRHTFCAAFGDSRLSVYYFLDVAKGFEHRDCKGEGERGDV